MAVGCPADAPADDDGAEVVTVCFGHPTLGQMRDGFWDWAIRVIAPDGSEVGRVVRRDSAKWDVEGRVRILAAEHQPGRHGRYWSFRLAIPEGCRAVHEA